MMLILIKVKPYIVVSEKEEIRTRNNTRDLKRSFHRVKMLNSRGHNPKSKIL